MIKKNISLKPYNTFGIESNASYFATFKTEKELKSILKYNEIKNAEKLILGGGSNVLLTDNFEGVVLKNEILGIQIVSETDKDVFLKAGAGEIWHDLVMYAVQHNYGGIENLSLIPGSVGAAPMQNIGAYGTEIKDVFFELEAIDVNTLEDVRFTKKRCKFGYRESIFKQEFKDKYIITNITLKLSKHPKVNTSYGAINDELKKMNVKNPSIKDVSQAVINIRKRKLPDPSEIGNSGSFFKNPVVSRQKFEALQAKFPNIAHYPISDTKIKLAAGWLIDHAGWKGKTFNSENGSYGVHKNQALVLVNYGGASGKDILNLSNEIINDIKNQFDVDLEREVNII